MTDFIWTPKSLQIVTAAMKLKKMLAHCKKSYDQPRQHIKKQRHYYFVNKGLPLVKAIIFSPVMYACESWTTKKAESQRIHAFGLWCWRRLLRVPWTARWSNQSILKEISPEYSGLMLKLKLQYFGHLIQRSNSFERLWCWERLKAGGEGDDREWDGWMASPSQWTWVWVNSGRRWLTGKPGVLLSMRLPRVEYQRSDWTD